MMTIDRRMLIWEKYHEYQDSMEKIMKNISILIAVILFVSTNALADVTITATGHPTVGMTGYTTYVISMEADAGETVTAIGIDFETTGQTTMNQINPAGLSTIFDNYPQALWDAYSMEKDQDSCFLFNSNDLTFVITSGAITATESDILLRAYFTGTSVTNHNIAQIVLPDNEWASYSGAVVIDDGNEKYEIVVGGTFGD